MNSLIWIAPRLLGVASIVFISLFALDVFNEGPMTVEMWQGFVIHLTPALLLMVVLLVAWRYERLGGFLFIAGAAMLVFGLRNHLQAQLLLGSPFALTGLLFWFSYWHARNRRR